LNSQKEPAKAVPIADMENNKPEAISNLFLPNLSEIKMQIPAPIMQPINAELVPQP